MAELTESADTCPARPAAVARGRSVMQLWICMEIINKAQYGNIYSPAAPSVFFNLGLTPKKQATNGTI